MTDGLGNQTSIKSQRSDTQVTSSNKKTDQNDENSLCPIIQMEGNTLSYVPLRIENEFKQRALIDTGACSNAISQSVFNKLSEAKLIKNEIQKSEFSRVKLASGKLVEVAGKIKLSFRIHDYQFSSDFIILPTMNSIILGNPFFKENKIGIFPHKNILQLPDITLQLNEINFNGKRQTVKVQNRFEIVTCQKTIVPPKQKISFLAELEPECSDIGELTGIVSPNRNFELSTELVLSSSISTAKQNKVSLYAYNTTDHDVTIPLKTVIGQFEILTPEQASQISPLDPKLLALAKFRNPENFEQELNMLIRDENYSDKNQPPKPPPDYKNLWFPTPETCQNPESLTPVQRKIYDEIEKMQKMSNIDPKNNKNDRKRFLDKFNWEKTLLTKPQIKQIENLLVENYDLFAKHRFDVGYNTEMKIKLTPSHDLPVYMQSPNTPIHLREELLIELALMQYYNLITTLTHSKYGSPIFAQRKSSGKLRILIDLRRINHLLRDDYKETNFPISNMNDATNHFAGKKLFNKLDCSQAYHCVQMADPLSVQLLSFNFSSRTYAYKCLAQGLSKSVTGFSSFVRHYLDPCLAGDLCTQYMDDIGIGVKSFDDLIPALTKVFECIRRSGLKLSPSKCEFGHAEITFLGNTITEKGMKPESEKIHKFLEKIKMPQTPKQVKRLLGFSQFFRNFLPNLNETLRPFYSLLKKDKIFNITDEHYEHLERIKRDLLNATSTTLRLAEPNKQFVILTDASYHGSGFVLMIEDHTEDGKTIQYAPVSFGSKLFNAAQLKLSIYCKEFLALYFALESFSHYIWGAEKPILVLTDNKSLTSFFQAKSIHPSLWNFLDRVLSFNIVLAHIPGKANAAADFMSRMQTNPNEVVELTLTDKIPVTEIKINCKAKTPDVTVSNIEIEETELIDEKLLKALQDTGNLESLLPHIKQALKNENTNKITKFIKLTNDHQLNALNYDNPLDEQEVDLTGLNLKQLKDAQHRDPIIKKVIAWIETGKNEITEYTNPIEKKYAKHLERLVVEDGILYRNFYEHTGKVSNKQYCVPEQLKKEVVYRLHNSRTAGHLGIVRTAHEFRQRFYFPGFTEFLVDYVKNCITCAQSKRVNQQYLKTPLQPLSSLQSFPGELLQIDLVGPFPAAPYKYVLSGIDVFSKYLFAVPLVNGSAKAVAIALTSIFFKHSYLPQTITSDLGSNFVSDLMHELSELLEIKLKHATLKHPHSIGLVERSHAALKRILKLNTNEQWSDWYRYVDLATFIHNTSYYSSIGCTPSLIFHGRQPTKPLDLRFKTNRLQSMKINSDYVSDLQRVMLEKFSETKDKLIQAYHKYRTYYDEKANSKPLTLHEYCLLLNPRLTTQSEFASKSKQIWIPLYRVEKVLTNSNYIVRKVGTHYTQCVHRIRIKPITPNYEIDDVKDLDPQNFITDPSLSKFRGEPELFDRELPEILKDKEIMPFESKNVELDQSDETIITFGIRRTEVPPAAPEPMEFPDPTDSDSDARENEPPSPTVAPDENPVDITQPNSDADDTEPRNQNTQPRQFQTPIPEPPTTIPHQLDETLEREFFTPTNQKDLQDTTIVDSREKPSRIPVPAERRNSLPRKFQIDSPGSPMPTVDQAIRAAQRTYDELQQENTEQPYSFRNTKQRKKNTIKQAVRNAKNDAKTKSSINELHLSVDYPNADYLVSKTIPRHFSFIHVMTTNTKYKKGLRNYISLYYPNIEHYAKSENLQPGQVIAYFDEYNNRWIYCIITNQFLDQKCKQAILREGIQYIDQHATKHNVHKLAAHDIFRNELINYQETLSWFSNFCQHKNTLYV